MFIFFKKQIQTFINWQCDVLYNYLDPFQDKSKSNAQNEQNIRINQFDQSGNKFKINYRFLFPFIVVIVFTVYGLIGLQYEHTGTIVLDWNDLVSNPYIFNHQIFLPVMWSQSDMIAIIGIPCCVAIYAVLIFNQIDEYRYKIVKLNEHDSKLIISSKGIPFKLVVFYLDLYIFKNTVKSP